MKTNKPDVDTDKKWVENYARVGMFTKGAVYILVGVLTTIAAFSVGGGESTGKRGAFKFLYEQPYGKVLLGILAIGLIGYVVWRFIQAFKNPEGIDNDTKGNAKRTGYAISGVFYALFAVYAATLIFQGGSSGGGESGKQQLLGTMLSENWGQWLLGLFAIGLFGKAFFQLYLALSGKFSKKVRESKLERHAQEIVRKAGLIGYVARGIVVGIIAYMLLQASIQADPSQAQGSSGAFSYLQNTGGSILLAAIAIGLAAYGVYMIVKSRYQYIPST